MWPFEKQRCGPEALTLLPNVPVQTQGDGRWKGTKCKDHCERSRRGLGLSLCAGGVFNHAVKWVVVGICWKEDEMHAACHYFQMYNNTCSLYPLPLLLATLLISLSTSLSQRLLVPSPAASVSLVHKTQMLLVLFYLY